MVTRGTGNAQKLALLTARGRSQETNISLGGEAQILDVPVSVLDLVLRLVYEDPDRVAEILESAQRRFGLHGEWGYSRLLLAVAASGRGQSRVSMVPAGLIPAVATAIAITDLQQGMSRPDVTYLVESGTIRVLPSEHLQPFEAPTDVSGSLIPFECWLRKKKSWAIEVLVDFYRQLACFQEGFIVTREPVSLRELPWSAVQLGLSLPFSPAIYYKLARGRAVRIEDPPRPGIYLPTSLLLPTKSVVLQYRCAAQMNDSLVEEFKTRRALSDAAMVTSGARRTVAKYRAQSRVPSTQGRQAAYEAGLLTPFRVTTPIDRFLHDLPPPT